MNILSLQSWVAYGHVGNAAAIFPLQRLGAEVSAVHTVQLANHTGYADAPGETTPPATIDAITTGLRHRGILGRLDGVLSGYLSDAAIGGAVLGAVRAAKAARPSCLYCCDPVLGDAGQLYVHADMPEFFRARALPLADIALPNAFELGLLSGVACDTREGAKRGLAALQALGPREVVLSGYVGQETPRDSLDLLLLTADGTYFLVRTPRLALSPVGAGDVLSALYLFHRLASGVPATALEAAASSLFGLLRATLESGGGELAIVSAQHEFIEPTTRFHALAC